MPGDNIIDPSADLSTTQRTCADNLHPNGRGTQLLGSAISGDHSMQTFLNPILRSSSISFIQTFCTSDLIVACSHKPRLQAHSSALTSSVRVIKFSTNLPRGTENFGLDLLFLSRPTLIGVRESLVESRTFHERCLGRVFHCLLLALEDEFICHV
jgi:hypothetical protein